MVASLCLALCPGASAGQLNGPYIDPNFLTQFGDYSYWLQPWRSYLETMPAATLVDAPGMSFNLNQPQDPNLVATMLARHGIRHVRIEIGWGSMSYADETQLDNGGAYVRQLLRAARDHGLRPTILLNSNSGVPCPALLYQRTVAAAAPAGSRTVDLTDASGLIPGYSGLSNLGGSYWAADALITSISGNTITLSKPLPDALQAGQVVPMATLKYRPFSDPSGPEYQDTVAGWDRYVGNVAAFVTNELGTAGASDKGFDLEVWNELTFGSEFLHINNYYDPAYQPYAPPGQPGYQENDIYEGRLIRETADYIDAHPTAFAGVTVSNGFANTIPWPASSAQPQRIGAISKHPYAGRVTYPAGDPHVANPGLTPVNALFGRETVNPFVPAFSAYLPEYFGNLLQTETMIRDMSPLTNSIYGTPHGRYARVINGSIVPTTTWMTEWNIEPSGDDPTVTVAAAQALKAKAAARALAFYANKGVTQLDFFGHIDDDRGLGLINHNFLQYASQPGAPPYPADDTAYTSPALAVVQRMTDWMGTNLDRSLASTRALTVTSIADSHDHIQYAGDGTPEHPSLFDRDVLAILPFQVNAKRFVIPYYVQTRDIKQSLAPEQFTVTLKGIDANGAKMTAYDPLNDAMVSVGVKARSATSAVLTLTATDSPILLTIQER